MNNNVEIISVPSEVGAGTRGARLGIEALISAGHTKESKFFTKFPYAEVAVFNEALYEKPDTKHAKHIESVYATCTALAREVSTVLGRDHFPLVISGDHSSAAGSIAGVKTAFPDQRIGVIWIDAHPDLQTPFTSETGNMHGMPLAVSLAVDNQEMAVNQPAPKTLKLWEELKNVWVNGPKIKPEDLVFIGIRDIDEPEQDIITRMGIRQITVADVRASGGAEAAKDALEKLSGCDKIYISFDVDSLDPSFSLGTGTPVEEGLTVLEANDLLTNLVTSHNVCCLEMTEINPLLDETNKMASIAFDLLTAAAHARLTSIN